MGLFEEQFSEEERRAHYERALAIQNEANAREELVGEPPQMLRSEYNPQESNIQGEAQAQYNQQVLAIQKQLLDDAEFEKMLRKERARTNSIGMFAAAMSGRSFTPQSISGPSRQGETSVKPDVDAVDIEKELAWDEWLHNPGETMDDLVLFTKRKNLSGDTFKYLADRFAAFDKGKKIPLYRWDEAKKDYDIIFRREEDDLDKEREAGYRVNRGDIDASVEASSDVEISNAITKARELFLSGNLKTSKDLQSFIKNNGITDHKVVAAIQSAYPDLISADDRVAMYDPKGNPVYVAASKQAEMLDKKYTLPNEFAVAQERKLNQIIANKLTSDDNEILTENEVKEKVLEEIKEQNLPVDLKDAMDAVEKAYGQEEKTRIKNADDTQKVLEKMDEFTNFGEMYKFFADNKIGLETINSMTDKIEAANPDWKYPTTMPGVLYNELGVPTAINSIEEYNKAKETGYQYFNYEDAPGRPKDTFDLSKTATGLRCSVGFSKNA